ncbi:MAG TPA: hypothetical protein VM577_07950 [Anaerovoracaceae bacterium]|nr:hypothetical protein [Anaerovoracaceae bacterium]
MRNRILTITIIMIMALLATGCGATKTVTSADGEKYTVNDQSVKANEGFARSDEDGNLTALLENDPDATSVASVVIRWADLTGNRSWETIQGDEEYGLFSEELKDVLINEQDDINQTRMGYEAQQTETKVGDIKASNIVIFPDGAAYGVVEYDMTLINSIDLEAAAEVGFDGIGSTKHSKFEFELQPDENGDYKITSFNNISDWKDK